MSDFEEAVEELLEDTCASAHRVMKSFVTGDYDTDSKMYDKLLACLADELIKYVALNGHGFNSSLAEFVKILGNEDLA